jgi:DNA-binding HxlR family transcriptional regulator
MTKYDHKFLELIQESGQARFRDFQTQLGLNDRTIREVLKRLKKKGLIEVYEVKPRRPIYIVTKDGRATLSQLTGFEDVKYDIDVLALEQEDLVELERQLDRLPSVRTFRELIDELLMRNGPMNYRKLTEEILKVKQTKGKTPDQTVLAILERGTRGPNPKYVKTGPGTYGLNPSYQPNPKSTRVKQLDGKLYVDLTEQLKSLNIKEDDEVNVVVENGKIVIY